jgi:thioredoxin reductase
MPAGMFLKSDGFASNLYDPDGALTLARYCAFNGIDYADLGLPVSLETFWRYGIAFQQRFVSNLEVRSVTELSQTRDGFRLILDNDEIARAQRVIVAVGISYYAHVPQELNRLPDTLVSHSSQHSDPCAFAGKEVIVLGAGASALDLAASLHGADASVRLVARRRAVAFISPFPKIPRPLTQRILAPNSGLGPGWRSRLCTDAPLLFHVMPERFRLEVVKRHLPAASPWWTRDLIEGKVPFLLGLRLRGASQVGDRVELQLEDDGARQALQGDHVIAATGYKVDLRRIPFLSFEFQQRIRSVEYTPILSSNFESSVPGLYFVGLSAANSFGPMMRFAFGAGYTARRLSRHLARARVPTSAAHFQQTAIEAIISRTDAG